MNKLNKIAAIFLLIFFIIFEILSILILKFDIKNTLALFAGFLITYLCFLLMQFFAKKTVELNSKFAMLAGTVGYLVRASIYIVFLFIVIKFFGKIPTFHLALGYLSLGLAIILIYIVFPNLIKPKVDQDKTYIKGKKINIFEKPVLYICIYNGTVYKTFKKFIVRKGK
ncbi:MAG: hypothetical protein LBD41_06990 [Clostridiales Family XIII bacterium]|jgi:hypothetical protein|nr:hypothetical protein [Clostridiales Family XIII bacterium]